MWSQETIQPKVVGFVLELEDNYIYKHVRLEVFLVRPEARRADVSCHMDPTPNRWSVRVLENHDLLFYQKIQVSKRQMRHWSSSDISQLTITEDSSRNNRLSTVFILPISVFYAFIQLR